MKKKIGKKNKKENKGGEFTTFDAYRTVIRDSNNKEKIIYIEAKKYDNSIDIDKTLNSMKEDYKTFIGKEILEDVEITKLKKKIKQQQINYDEAETSEDKKDYKNQIKTLQKELNQKTKEYIKPINPSNNKRFSQYSSSGIPVRFTKFNLYNKPLEEMDEENPDEELRGKHHIVKLQNDRTRVKQPTRDELTLIAESKRRDILYVILTNKGILSTSQKEYLKKYEGEDNILDVSRVTTGPYKKAAKDSTSGQNDHLLLNLHNFKFIDTSDIDSIPSGKLLELKRKQWNKRKGIIK